MGSDRARVSYDPSRHWRGVVYQEGRVTLEADWNEAETIADEGNREQLLDIVGPSGTPDNGYQVVPVVDEASSQLLVPGLWMTVVGAHPGHAAVGCTRSMASPVTSKYDGSTARGPLTPRASATSGDPPANFHTRAARSAISFSMLRFQPAQPS